MNSQAGIPADALARLTALLPAVLFPCTYLIAAASGHVDWCVPPLQGCTDITHTGLKFPESHLFRVAMPFVCGLFAFLWLAAYQWIQGIGGATGSRERRFRNLGVIAAEEFEEGGLGTGRALGAAQLEAAALEPQPLEIEQVLVEPQSGPLAHRGRLRGLEVGRFGLGCDVKDRPFAQVMGRKLIESRSDKELERTVENAKRFLFLLMVLEAERLPFANEEDFADVVLGLRKDLFVPPGLVDEPCRLCRHEITYT